MRSHAMGGPAWRTVSRVMPGTTSIAGRTSTRIWWAARRRSRATRLAASTVSHQSEASASAAGGGRQSTRRTGTPWATSAAAKSSGPTTTAPSGSRRKLVSGGIASFGDRPRGLGGDPVARAHDRAELAEALLLPLEALRVLVGADDVGDHRQLEPTASRARLGERRPEGAGRVRVRTVAEHEIEQQHGHPRLVRRADDRGVAQHGVGDGGRRRLRDDEQDSRVDVGGERADCLERREAADGSVEIASARADRVRDAGTETMNEARHLLETGSRGADDTDGPPANSGGDDEAHAVDARRPAPRPHPQEAAGAGATLERHLVVHGHAVAEEKHVEAGRKRLMRVDGGVAPPDG